MLKFDFFSTAGPNGKEPKGYSIVLTLPIGKVGNMLPAYI